MSATLTHTAALSPADYPTSRKFLIFSIMAFGMFLALIDIQIVAASLNDVQARMRSVGYRRRI